MTAKPHPTSTHGSAPPGTSRRGGALLLAGLLLGAALGGCARIRFRAAMGRVQRAYASLAREVEAKQRPETLERSREVKRALEDPTILESSLHERETDFRDLLQGVMDSLENFDGDADADLDALLNEVSIGCQSCHGQFRD